MLKLLQRHLYSFLSTRAGFGICLVGLLVTINSFVVLLSRGCSGFFFAGHCTHTDWTNNLRGVSFEQRLAHEPIDVVYTWVNG